MNSKMNEKRWSYVPAVIGYVSVAIVGLNDINSSQKLLWAALLLGLFGLFYFIHLPCNAPENLKQTRVGIQAGLITGLLVIQPGWSVFPLLFFLVSAEVVFDFKIKTGLIWVFVFTLLTALAFTFDIGWTGLVQLLPFAAGYFFFAIFGWYRVQAVEERQEAQKLLAELQTAHEQLRQYTIQLEEFTIARERNRIARDMHDTLGHRLTIASVQLEGAQRMIHTDPERVDKIIGTVREQVKEGLGELRRTVAMLRASEEEDLPMAQSMTQLANQVQEATGIPIHVSIAADISDMSSVYRQAFYRAAQEGLTNIQRHSKASQAWLQLNQVTGDIQLLISDNGTGYSTNNTVTGFGLIGLKERATLLNGKFSIAPRPGGGTQLSFSLPMEKIHDD
jgi:signal transduction histidine kinase